MLIEQKSYSTNMIMVWGLKWLVRSDIRPQHKKGQGRIENEQYKTHKQYTAVVLFAPFSSVPFCAVAEMSRTNAPSLPPYD